MEATNEILIAKMHTYILKLAQAWAFYSEMHFIIASKYSVNPQFTSPTHNAILLTGWVLSNGTEVEQIC